MGRGRRLLLLVSLGRKNRSVELYGMHDLGGGEHSGFRNQFILNIEDPGLFIWRLLLLHFPNRLIYSFIQLLTEPLQLGGNAIPECTNAAT